METTKSKIIAACIKHNRFLFLSTRHDSMDEIRYRVLFFDEMDNPSFEELKKKFEKFSFIKLGEKIEIKNGFTQIVFLEAPNFTTCEDIGNEERGFLDEEFVFLNRDAAAERARETGQIKKEFQDTSTLQSHMINFVLEVETV